MTALANVVDYGRVAYTICQISIGWNAHFSRNSISNPAEKLFIQDGNMIQ